MAEPKNAYDNIEREFTLVGQKLADDPLEVELPIPVATPSLEGMEMQTNEDGSVEFGMPESADVGEAQFMDNLAEFINEDELTGISSMVLEKTEEDKSSRKDWLSAYTKGLDLLSMKTVQNLLLVPQVLYTRC